MIYYTIKIKNLTLIQLHVYYDEDWVINTDVKSNLETFYIIFLIDESIEKNVKIKLFNRILVLIKYLDTIGDNNESSDEEFVEDSLKEIIKNIENILQNIKKEFNYLGLEVTEKQ